MSLEERDLACDLVWKPAVIRIEERDQLAPSTPDALVSRRPRTLVLLEHVLDATLDERRHRGCRVVGRSVVDHDDLDERIVLVQDALEGLGEVLRVVVRRDDDADQRPTRHIVARLRGADR